MFRSLAPTQKLGEIVLVSNVNARSGIQAGAWSSLAGKSSEVVRDCEMVRRLLVKVLTTEAWHIDFNPENPGECGWDN